MNHQVISTLPLLGVEKFFCLHGGWLTIAHAAHLSGNYSMVISNASNALQCLLKRHSRMRTRLRVDDNRYFLDNLQYNNEQLSSDLFFSAIEIRNESWQEIVERRCNQDPYSNNGTVIFPMFHFMLLFNSEQSDDQLFHLILFQNHCVSDGQSGFILIHEFLTLATTSNALEISEPLNTEILPLLGQLIPRPYGLFYHIIAFIGRYIFIRELRQLTHPRIPVKSIPLNDCQPTRFKVQRYKIRFLFASSSSNLYSKLHPQCRLHGVTLNGPLMGCLLLAIHHCFPLDDNTLLKPFGLGALFNMRSRLPQSPLTPSSIGFFAGTGEVKLKQSLSIRSTQFWTLAHYCMTNTQNQLKRDGVPLTMNIFADVLRNEQEFDETRQLFPEGRFSELGFSNIGKYPFFCKYNEGEVQLQGIHVINNMSVYRTSTDIFVTCTDNKQLDFAMAHEIESDEMAHGFLEYYLRLIELCADSERCKSETTLHELLKMME
ncbi:unnamed protein product [Adineta steineri]|uniref:Condensation domain-containing protein n=1 Tax=Adineta steineri TaxID=433720 RepID=A0A814YD34_9BILA|nr:unnamed protein product [Adineta steineri]CAF1315117.1 unnamed protein product [Adineta steineri]